MTIWGVPLPEITSDVVGAPLGSPTEAWTTWSDWRVGKLVQGSKNNGNPRVEHALPSQRINTALRNFG